MYNKGSLMLHTLRSIISDDELWFEIIMGISLDFKYRNIDGQDIIDYINQKTRKDFSYFFKQYLKTLIFPSLYIVCKRKEKYYFNFQVERN